MKAICTFCFLAFICFFFCAPAMSADIREAFGYMVGVAPPAPLDKMPVVSESSDTQVRVYLIPSKESGIDVFNTLEMHVSNITGNVFQIYQSKTYSSSAECEKDFQKLIPYFEKKYNAKATINAFNWYKFRSDNGKRFIDIECNVREKSKIYTLDFKLLDAEEGKKISAARSRNQNCQNTSEETTID